MSAFGANDVFTFIPLSFCRFLCRSSMTNKAKTSSNRSVWRVYKLTYFAYLPTYFTSLTHKTGDKAKSKNSTITQCFVTECFKGRQCYQSMPTEVKPLQLQLLQHCRLFRCATLSLQMQSPQTATPSLICCSRVGHNVVDMNGLVCENHEFSEPP